MRCPRRLVCLASSLAFCSFVSCGSPKTFDSVSTKPEVSVQAPKYVNALAAADLAVTVQERAYAFSVAAVKAEEPRPREEQPQSVSVSTPPSVTTDTAAATPSSIDWHCVAVAETGADFAMHGPTYSTAYGVVNDIVYQYASPEVQAKVFAGTASEAEQTDIVARFAADHGTGGWGELTKQKCGL